MNKEFRYPRGTWVRLKWKLDRTEQGKLNTGASKLFLEAMRPVLQKAVTHNEQVFYVSPGEMEDHLNQCDEKFTNLLEFISQLPMHVRIELGQQLVDTLEETLTALIPPKRTRHPKLPGARNFFRAIFLNEMVDEYKKTYGTPPNHTYSRKGDPQESKAKGFHGVAYEMCKMVGFSQKGIEKELAAIKAIKPPREIEEVRAEIKARSAAQST